MEASNEETNYKRIILRSTIFHLLLLSISANKQFKHEYNIFNVLGIPVLHHKVAQNHFLSEIHQKLSVNLM